MIFIGSQKPAISAKIHSKLSKCLNYDDLIKIANMQSLHEVVRYLKKSTGYKKALVAIDENVVQRGKFEILLRKLVYQEARSFLCFAQGEIKEYLKLYRIKDEIESLKLHLRLIFHKNSDVVKQNYDYAIEMTEKLNFLKSIKNKTLEDFVKSIKGTRYHFVLASLSGKSVFVIENALDFYYKRLLLKMVKNFSDKDQRLIMEKNLGLEFDAQNIMTILRSKFCYRLNKDEIYSYLIPHFYKLNSNTINYLIDAITIKDCLVVLSQTWYKRIVFKIKKETVEEIEKSFFEMSRNLIRILFRKSRISIMTPEIYLKYKEIEIENIINVVESIRYGLKTSEIMKDIEGEA